MRLSRALILAVLIAVGVIVPGGYVAASGNDCVVSESVLVDRPVQGGLGRVMDQLADLTLARSAKDENRAIEHAREAGRPRVPGISRVMPAPCVASCIAARRQLVGSLSFGLPGGGPQRLRSGRGPAGGSVASSRNDGRVGRVRSQEAGGLPGKSAGIFSPRAGAILLPRNPDAPTLGMSIFEIGVAPEASRWGRVGRSWRNSYQK